MATISFSSHATEFDHQFLVIARGGRVSDQIAQAGSVCKVLGVSSKIPSLAAFLGIRSEMRKLRPAIVHSHGAEANFHAMLARATLLAERPIGICEEIGIPNHGRLGRNAFKIIYALAAVVVSVSEATKSKILQLGEAKNDKVRVLDSPVRTIAQPSRGRRSFDSITIGFVGRLEPIKNPLALVEAVAILRAKALDVNLMIIGEGSLGPFILSRVEALGLSQCVRLTGYVAEPETILQEADMLVQPSASEGLSIAMLEAMAAGIPVITTSKGGSPEVVKDGVTGWLVEDNRPETIADKVMEVISLSPKALTDVGSRASSLVLERFTIQQYLGKLDLLYSGLLDEYRLR